MNKIFKDRITWKIQTSPKDPSILIILRDGDHPDAHVHAIANGKEDSFDIRTGRSIHNVITGRDAKRIRQWILDNRLMLKQAWNHAYPKSPIRDVAHAVFCRDYDSYLLVKKIQMQMRHLARLVRLLEIRYSIGEF